MSENIELLPCPFCGNIGCVGESDNSFYVACCHCNVEMYPYEIAYSFGKTNPWTKEEAIKQWNTRTPKIDLPTKCKCHSPDSVFTVTIKNEISYCPRCGGIVFPKGNGLVALDKQSIEDAIDEALIISNSVFGGKYIVNCIADVIVRKFGTPKPALPSVEDIKEIMLPILLNPKHRDAVTDEIIYELATAIHKLIMEKNR